MTKAGLFRIEFD